jgi:hypothetical protein
VKLNESGAGPGTMIVARACSEMVSGSEETPNVSSVIRSLIEGNGLFGPGEGNPGKAGTAIYPISRSSDFGQI